MTWLDSYDEVEEHRAAEILAVGALDAQTWDRLHAEPPPRWKVESVLVFTVSALLVIWAVFRLIEWRAGL